MPTADGMLSRVSTVVENVQRIAQIELPQSDAHSLPIEDCGRACEHPVKLYAELNVAAFQRGEDRQLALWYALRALNASGSGCLDYGRALVTLAEYAYSKITARRILRLGRGAFWQIENTEDGSSRIILKSLLAVCQHLRVERISWPVEISSSSFRGLRRRRAAMYAAWICHREARPTSRAAIAKITGIGRRRQQRYDLTAGIRKRPNFAFYEDVDGRLVPMLEEYEGKSQVYEMPRQLPNSFVPVVTRAARGMISRVNAELHRCSLSGDATVVSEAKTYFETSTAAAKCRNRSPEAFVRSRVNPLVRGQAWVLA